MPTDSIDTIVQLFRLCGSGLIATANLRRNNYLNRQLWSTSDSGELIMSITPIERVLFSAKPHTTGGREGGASHIFDGRLDVKLSG